MQIKTLVIVIRLFLYYEFHIYFSLFLNFVGKLGGIKTHASVACFSTIKVLLSIFPC